MTNNANTLLVFAAPLLEQAIPLLKDLVWAAFWLIVLFSKHSEIRELTSALVALINRVQSVKAGGVLVEIFPPENPATITQDVKEKHTDLEQPAAQKGVHLLPHEGVAAIKKMKVKEKTPNGPKGDSTS